MSGASALAAAKRRRTHTVPEKLPLSMNGRATTNEDAKGVQYGEQKGQGQGQGQVPHPMAILRAHELRLNEVDKNQTVIDETLQLFAQEINNVKTLNNEVNNIRSQISELKNMLYKLQNMVITSNLSNDVKNTKSKTVKALDTREANEEK